MIIVSTSNIYIYTGRVKDLDKKAMDLFVAADRFVEMSWRLWYFLMFRPGDGELPHVGVSFWMENENHTENPKLVSELVRFLRIVNSFLIFSSGRRTAWTVKQLSNDLIKY